MIYGIHKKLVLTMENFFFRKFDLARAFIFNLESLDSKKKKLSFLLPNLIKNWFLQFVEKK